MSTRLNFFMKLKESKITQRELAKKTGLTERKISRVINRYEDLQDKEWIDIATILKTNPDWIRD